MRVLEVVSLAHGALVKYELSGVFINPTPDEYSEHEEEIAQAAVILTRPEGLRNVPHDAVVLCSSTFSKVPDGAISVGDRDVWYVGNVFAIAFREARGRIFPIIHCEPLRITVGFLEDLGVAVDTYVDILIAGESAETAKRVAERMNIEAGYLLVKGGVKEKSRHLLEFPEGKKFFFTRHLKDVILVSRVPDV